VPAPDASLWVSCFEVYTGARVLTENEMKVSRVERRKRKECRPVDNRRREKEKRREERKLRAKAALKDPQYVHPGLSKSHQRLSGRCVGESRVQRQLRLAVGKAAESPRGGCHYSDTSSPDSADLLDSCSVL
jgi:hypothetical protein